MSLYELITSWLNPVTVSGPLVARNDSVPPLRVIVPVPTGVGGGAGARAGPRGGPAGGYRRPGGVGAGPVPGGGPPVGRGGDGRGPPADGGRAGVGVRPVQGDRAADAADARLHVGRAADV